MGKIIKREVIAYKGMNSDMTCKGFQYEIGETYKTDKAELCECGFHACLNPRDVFAYYSKKTKSRYFKVSLSGEITKCDFEDTKVAATEITILEEITDNFDECIKTTEWWKNNNVLDLLHYQEDFARVQREDRLWNFIDKDGKLLFNEWFEIDYVWHFQEGFAGVERSDSLCNFIDKDGKLLFDKWFDYLDNFHEGFAIVQRSDKQYNFINKNGKFLSDEWFNYLNNFSEGFARVQRTNGEWVKIDKTGNLIKNLQ